MTPEQVFDEQVKLRATWLNVISGGLIITGTIGPVLRLLSGDVDWLSWQPAILGATALLAFGVGIVLHRSAQRALRRALQ